MIVPTIHLNGTSGTELLEQVTDAGQAIYEAVKVLQKAFPHARDYYVQPDYPAEFEQARKEWEARREHLMVVYRELEDLAGKISNEIDSREFQKK